VKSYLRNSTGGRNFPNAQAGLAFCALALLASPAVGRAAPVTANDLFSPPVAQRLSAEIAEAEKQHNLPSVAVEVSIPGRGSYSFVDGYANLNTRLRRTLAQPFRIASITKPFAATAVLVLVDRGVLRKTDPISKWYPNFPNANKITVDQH
jgi:D-alanyl-D-alanine carboxypeptidase